MRRKARSRQTQSAPCVNELPSCLFCCACAAGVVLVATPTPTSNEYAFYVKKNRPLRRVARTCTSGTSATDPPCVCVFYVKGYGSPLRQVLQCGRPPGFTQTAAPRVVPLPSRRCPRNLPVEAPAGTPSVPLGTPGMVLIWIF